MARVVDVADRVATADLPLLLTGERGNGRRLVARWIHDRSCRRYRRFLTVACGYPRPVPAGDLRSSLGKMHTVSPVLETVAGGTVFVDDVGELTPAQQRELVGWIDESRSEPGDGGSVRLIAATRHDLASLAKSGAFRPDLLYRINALELRIPSLEERPEDIPPLLRHFVRSRFCRASEAIVSVLVAELGRRPRLSTVAELERVCCRMLRLVE